MNFNAWYSSGYSPNLRFDWIYFHFFCLIQLIQLVIFVKTMLKLILSYYYSTLSSSPSILKCLAILFVCSPNTLHSFRLQSIKMCLCLLKCPILAIYQLFFFVKVFFEYIRQFTVLLDVEADWRLANDVAFESISYFHITRNATKWLHTKPNLIPIDLRHWLLILCCLIVLWHLCLPLVLG